MEQLKTHALLDIEQTIAKNFFKNHQYPYEILSNINKYINDLLKELDLDYFNINGTIAIAKDANVSEKAVIIGPVIIDSKAEIRPFSYIRGNVIIGKNCVVGNATELKNSIMFNNSQAPHFNYIGNSILGYKSHIGAGVILSNLRQDKKDIIINYNNQKIVTNLKKMGAIIGDNVEVGCNAVLNPGTIIGKNTNIYPLSSVRGYVNSDSIYKSADNIVTKI